MQITDKITKNIFIEDLVEDYPELVAPLMDFGIVCLVCGEPAWGTLEEQAESKGVTNIDDIVNKLNELIK